MRFRDFSINGKFVTLIALTTGSALLVMYAAIVGFELVRYDRARLQRARDDSARVGAQCATALTHGNQQEIHDTLELLWGREDLAGVTLYRADGQLVATVPADAPAVVLLPGALTGAQERRSRTDIEIAQPIRLGTEIIGAIAWRERLTSRTGLARRYALIVGAVVVLAMGYAVVLGLRLRRMVTRPVVDLTEVMRAVATRQDYTLRAAVPPGRDEIRELVTGFNGMLAEISRHQAAQRRLENEILEIAQREQTRIGQDLHDGLCQHLVGTAFVASMVATELTEQRLPQASQARKLAALLDDAISQARQLARGLYPVHLATGDLSAALAVLAGNLSQFYAVRCDYHPGPRLHRQEPAVAAHVYRIAQEAVANAVKHGHPGRIQIGLQQTADRVTLTVTDDGVGIPANHEGTEGMGLHIMDYRARNIGGQLRIERQPAGGTRLTCDWPAPHPEEELP